MTEDLNIDLRKVLLAALVACQRARHDARNCAPEEWNSLDHNPKWGVIANMFDQFCDDIVEEVAHIDAINQVPSDDLGKAHEPLEERRP